MKISNNTQQYINQSYTNSTGNAAKTTTANPKKSNEDTVATDSINLSSTTRDLQRISAASTIEQPDRAKKVEDLKQQVQTNQYTVNAEQVAAKMITGSVMNELV